MKAKFNVMDALIILLVLAVAAFGIYMLADRGNKDAAGQTGKPVYVDMMLELSAKDESFTKIPKAGDAVSVGEKEKMDAVVTKVESVPAVSFGYDILNGKAAMKEVPGKYDVRIYMRAEGTESNKSVSVNNTPLHVGEQFAVFGKEWAGFGTMLEVNTADKQEAEK